MDGIPKIGNLPGIGGLDPEVGRARETGFDFAGTLKEAIVAVDKLQQESEAAQQAHANNEEIDLHDVLIKIEEAEVAFKTMMEIRNKLVDAYREVMRMGA